MADVSGIIVTITCPVCSKEFKKKAKDMPNGTVIKCPGCGETTTIRGDTFSDLLKGKDAESDSF